MYTWDGRWIEPDDDSPTLRRHCTRCGAFLPKEPTERVWMIPTDWYYTYEQGECTGMVIVKEEEERDDVWICTKCKKEYDSKEMYQ